MLYNMLFGKKLGSDAQYYGNKLRKDVKFGSKQLANGLHKVNSLAVPALALSGNIPAAGTMKAAEGLVRGISKAL